LTVAWNQSTTTHAAQGGVEGFAEATHLILNATLSSSSAIIHPDTICHASASFEGVAAVKGDGAAPRAEAWSRRERERRALADVSEDDLLGPGVERHCDVFGALREVRCEIPGAAVVT
jgi:hypothetical protein